jgi:hypothetical protein
MFESSEGQPVFSLAILVRKAAEMSFFYHRTVVFISPKRGVAGPIRFLLARLEKLAYAYCAGLPPVSVVVADPCAL